jgi:DHA1 family inner membrane transport protein
VKTDLTREGAGTPSLLAVAPLCLAAFAGLLNVGALAPFIATIADDLGTSVALLGLAATGSLLMTAGGGLLVGPLADYVGYRQTIAAGLLAIALAALLGALAVVPAMFVLARLIGGLGFAVTGGVTTAAAARRFPGEGSRKAIGYVSAVGVSAGIVGAPLLTSIATLAGWRGAYLVVMTVAIGASVAIWLGIGPDGGDRMECFSPATVLAAYRPLVSDRRTPRLFAANGLQACCLIGALTYAGAFFTDELGFSLREVGYAYMLSGVGGFLGSVAAGDRLARVPARAVFGLAMALMGALWLAIFVLAPGPVASVVLFALAAFVQVAGWVSLAALLAEETPAGLATTMVFNGSVFGLGGAVGTAAGSVLLGIGGYAALGIALPLAAFGAAALALAGRRPSPGSE